MSIKRNDRGLCVGKGADLDKTAHIGALPLRRIGCEKIVIGPAAVCMSGSVIYLGSTIGRGLIIAHNAVIREECSIGDYFRLWSNSVIDYGCRIGTNVKIHSNVYVAQYTVIEDDCFLAPGVVIANDQHPGCEDSRECMEKRAVLIKKGAQIGCNATILPGVVIGVGAMVGAGSVVTKSVPAGSVVCGNPARVVKTTAGIECKLYPGKRYRGEGCKTRDEGRISKKAKGER